MSLSRSMTGTFNAAADPHRADRVEAFFDAIVAGDVEALQKLHRQDQSLIRSSIDDYRINAALYNNLPPLMASVWAGPECFSWLLANGADVEQANSYAKPIHVLATKGDEKMLAEIIAAKADINAKIESTGFSPLMCALTARHESAVDVLLQAGADLFVVSLKGETASSIAQAWGDEAVLQKLQQRLDQAAVTASQSGLARKEKMMPKIVLKKDRKS